MDCGRNARTTRREVLAGLGTLAFRPPAAERFAEISLRSVLDRAAIAREPEQMLSVLRRSAVGGLSAIDLALVRMVARGLEREVDLRRRSPLGKAGGSSPYVLSQRHGAYLQLQEPKVPPAEQARQLDEETVRLHSEAALGLSPPRFILDALLQAEAELQTKAVPEVRTALARQMAALERLRAVAVAEPGMWRLPGGEAYYRLRLRCTSGLDATPMEIERRVAAETAALLHRADGLLKGFGLSRGTVGERLRALKRRPAWLYANDEAGRVRAVAGMNDALARLRPHLGAWFNPPLEPGGTVRRMSEADERARRRGYREPATAGSLGAYYPDLAAVRERPAWTLATVAFHETMPGHLLQLGREKRADPHPLQVKYAPGYAEGWAIYAEALVDAMGLLSPVEQLGFIQSLLFRLARVTADIGIHLRRWDRTRAIRYLEETVGFELFFPFEVEVDRYAVEPAAFAGDAMVALTLRRLGRRAAAAGTRHLRGFHDAVLNRGPLSAEAIPAIV
jgi:uncharacterized protein (DUF885 family)